MSQFDECHHNAIFRELNFKMPLPPTYKRQMWDYEKANGECVD